MIAEGFIIGVWILCGYMLIGILIAHVIITSLKGDLGDEEDWDECVRIFGMVPQEMRPPLYLKIYGTMAFLWLPLIFMKVKK